jgi:hypothetical protein
MILTEFISNKDKFFELIKNDWLAAGDTFPDFLPEVSKEQKLKNEAYIDTITADFNKQLKKYHRLPLGRRRWRDRTFGLLYNILEQEEVLGIHHYMNRSELEEFVNELKEFMQSARSFAPELPLPDIGQAIRNYMVYVMFKKIHLTGTGYHSAAFGYSMLYPFTDNYIDNVLLSSADKKEYNRLIHDKIEGREVHPKTAHQKKTCELLQYIETLYPRNQKPEVCQLLLLMLDAQDKSLRQQNRDFPLTDQERLDISICKGGISVLMDRVFVDQELTREDLLFYLSFGFFLQLADDLQDIKEDSTQGHSSLFTVSLSPENEERVLNRLLCYLHGIMRVYPAPNDHFKQFLLYNSYLLIYTSVIRSREFFSKDYLAKIEQLLPVSLTCLEKHLNNRLEVMDQRMQEHYLTPLDELVK